MGTPDFAVPSLRILADSPHDIVGVITAVDKAAGRGLKVRESAVKKFAADRGFTLLQPPNLKNPDFQKTLSALKADL